MVFFLSFFLNEKQMVMMKMLSMLNREVLKTIVYSYFIEKYERIDDIYIR